MICNNTESSLLFSITAKGSVPVKAEKKRKLEEAENLNTSAKKTKPVQMITASDNSFSPSGLIWDGDDYSCAYDALLTILYEIWSTDTKAWTRRFKEINQRHLKTARDTIRDELHI